MKATTLLHVLESAKVFEEETRISKEVYVSILGEERECSSIRVGRDRIVLSAEADSEEEATVFTDTGEAT